MTTADSADMEVDLALVDADQGSPPKEGASKSKSPSRPCQRGRSKRRGENAAGKAKARAAREKKPKKSGRNVEAGESMTCPVCGVETPKMKNTCYCPDHKRTTDALFRQAKKNPEVKKKVAELEFKTNCPTPGNNLPRASFDFLVFMQKEKVALTASHTEEREPMTKKQWVQFAQQVMTHDMTETEAIAEWNKMVSNPDEYERASKDRRGQMRIWCPTKESKSLARSREESYELTRQCKQQKFKQADLEELQEDLRNRSGFSSVLSDDWKPYTGGQAAAVGSSLVNASGYTSAGKSQSVVKSLEEVVSSLQDVEPQPALPDPTQPVAEDDPRRNPKVPKTFDPDVWKTLRLPQFSDASAKCAKQLSELEELALTAEDAAAPQVQDHLTKMATIAPQQVKATNVLHLLDSWLTTSMAEWQVVLGSAAAVSLAEEMPTLSSLEPLLELETAGDSKIQAVKTFEQSLSVNGFLKEQTKLMKSLKASVAQAYGKIATTIKTYQKAHKQTLEKKAAAEKKAQKAQAKKKPKSNGDDGTEAASSPSMVGFQNSTPLLAPEFLKGCKAVQGFESADAFRADAGLKWDTPFVVKGIQSPVRERFENPRLRQSAEYFESVLSEKSDSLVRAKCMPDNAGEAQKCLSSLAPAELVVDLGTIQLSDDKVRRSVSGVRLVAQGSKPYIGYDYDDLASFEVAVKGQKQALLFRPCADLSFLVGEDGRLLPAETQLSKLKALTPEQCEQLKPHAMVHTLTVSEALFWPAGWIGVFSAVGKATTFSLALPVLLRAGDASLLWSTSAPRQALLDAWKAAQQQQQAKVEAVDVPKPLPPPQP
ncbi:unnamed protein product [Durusdinium trenchii]|uniref:Uncharacterized protein n=1 Tax=Durusdinium trenchii TaxID=1381693 RepID=A0ABP0S9G5_9DINO